MNIGKLPNRLLNELIIEQIKKQGAPEEVLAGPSVGEDCALLDFGGDMILVSTDPITASEKGAGRLLINVCVNDIAAGGGTPVGIAVTALFPPGVTEEDIKNVTRELLDEAQKRNISLIGGHTEITDAVIRTVLSGTALGRVARGAQKSIGGASPGDKIFITKSVGLEGSAILAGEFEKLLLDKYGRAFIETVKGYGRETSVVKEARIVRSLASGMHDITEGGVLGACAEAAEASGCGFDIDLRRVSVTQETRAICEYFNISPFELISSGSLLITAPDAKRVSKALEENGVEYSVIGKVIKGESRVIGLDGKTEPLAAPAADALYTALRFTPAAKTVVFVCTGNTCRSPMAEGFAKSLSKEGYKFISRGISALGGEISENALLAMKENGIDMQGFKSASFTDEDAQNAYLILTMTEAHKTLLLSRCGVPLEGKTFTLREYAFKTAGDITDPFGCGRAEYLSCAKEIKECVSKVIERL